MPEQLMRILNIGIISVRKRIFGRKQFQKRQIPYTILIAYSIRTGWNMNITVIGTGYVGLVSGTCLSDFGFQVTCVDIDEKKIKSLNSGIIPIYEPGLEDLVVKNVRQKRLFFTTDMQNAVTRSEVIFIAVGTPPREDGSADMQYVLQAASSIASCMKSYTVVVNKSTVPIGTVQQVTRKITEVLEERGENIPFDVVSNPEFLREGSAVQDFTHPDRIVIGTASERARNIMRNVYRVLYLNNTPFLETTPETAEMIKYASNAFLALKITYINEIANLCEAVGANVKDVSRAMGMDGRISSKFLHAGPGYGGSCFPKDTQAIARIARDSGSRITTIEAAITANEYQKQRMSSKVIQRMGDLSGKTLAVLGITFKPRTDDMRDAPSLVILPELVKAGASLQIFDPQGEKEGPWRFTSIADHITFCSSEAEAYAGADGVLILTEWNQFRQLPLKEMKESMKGFWFFDFRNIYQRALVEEAGFFYEGVGC